MERMKQFWNRYSMRAVAMLLAIVTFLNVPFSAYASVSTPSDMDIMGESVEGEYMPDNIISRYEKSFEYCPETPPNPRSRIAISGSLVAAFVALLAACGIYVGNNTSLVQDIINGFDTYLRRTAGNVKSVMEAWAAILTIEAGITISGIKLLLPYLRDYLKTFFTGYGTGALEYSFSTGAGALTDGPYHPRMTDDLYVCSVIGYNNPNIIFDIAKMDLGNYSAVYPLAVHSSSNNGQYLNVAYLVELSNGDVKFVNHSPSYLTRTYVPVDNAYKYSDDFKYSLRIAPTSSTAESVVPYYQNIANSCTLPFFKSIDYARAFVMYGTMDGLVNPTDDYKFTVPNAWTQLQQDVFDRFGNTLTLPATEAEWQALQVQLEAAKNSDEALKALSSVIDVNGGSSGGTVITPAVAYSNLSYVITILAGYCGAVLTNDQINRFIIEFAGVEQPSDSDERAKVAEYWAAVLLSQYVSINGGSTDPDDDNRNNSYKVLKKLAVSLGAFLIGLGLVSDAPNFDNNPTVNNVQVVEDLPDPSPNPNPNPDSGVDLSGVLGFLQSILNVLNTWANPLALMDSLTSKLGLPTISDGIKSAISNLPKLISGELTLPELFGNVTDAIFSLPQQVADAIAKVLGLEKALEGLGLKKLFDNVIELLPDALVEGFALPDLFSGLQSVVGNIPKVIAELFGLVSGFSLNDALNSLGQKISELPNAFAEKFPQGSESSDSQKEDSEDGGLRKLIKAFLMLMFILIILLIFFLNCLRLITVIFAIPANTDLFNEDVLAGLEFLKTTQIPLFNVSIHTLLMGCVYFLIFTSIISLLRKQINHLKIRG